MGSLGNRGAGFIEFGGNERLRDFAWEVTCETNTSSQTQIETPRPDIKDKVVSFINQALPSPTVIPSLDFKPNVTSTPKDGELTKNKPCTLTGGETVESGWRGKDTGSNYCNNCFCTI